MTRTERCYAAWDRYVTQVAAAGEVVNLPAMTLVLARGPYTARRAEVVRGCAS